ncbi:MULTISPECIES: D-ribose pyranase [Carnobacterium]|uniref:D-ribose pyranase n=1 Tax=Carnobacterium divergens TaxID=2748 RepID=A0A2R8A0S3_CARDV|nr:MULTISPECIES: D-ribose pyranase [Carnobacterium]MCO6017833.1 D-ribose pyranase [Carnobacterium divergens]MDT1938812.1 D-ribose pyranase [Carnobacterium divergens]MDT1941250.1 D-ribose pyranase [Carnobacterium divergens]MDT1947048.1 D-ribose pyranase [Carnobacterium divergens]MDT1949485.1 D-ribose pyranase [Carnobacterium divergens]
MKKNGILNSEIAKVLADLGHTDQIVIADAGLPIPKGVAKIDLALSLQDPPFQKILALLLQEMEVESAILADEIQQMNVPQLKSIHALMLDRPLTFVSHEAFKERTKEAKVIIRTGEATPYSNIILEAGVIF